MHRLTALIRHAGMWSPGAAIGVILLCGLGVRIWHLDYDQGMGSHPDERSNSYYAVSIAWPPVPADILNPRTSPLNPFWDTYHDAPRNFTYGHFPLYLGVIASSIVHRTAALGMALGLPDSWLQTASHIRSDPPTFLFAGRLVIALLDTATIGLLFLLARRIYGMRTALLAALLYALALMPVKDSHYFTFDLASTTFVTMAVLGCVWMVQDPERVWGVVLAGLGMGLGVSSKFSALPIVWLPLMAGLLRFRAHRHADPGVPRAQLLGSVAGQLLWAWIIALGAFVLTSPFVLLDWERFRTAVLVQQGAMVRGTADWPFTRQYRGTLPYLYFIQQQLAWGLWYPLGLTALASTIWIMLRLGMGRLAGAARWLPGILPGEVLGLAWIIPYFGLTGAFLAKFNRYMTPLLPLAILFGAALLGWLCGWWGNTPPVAALRIRWRQAGTGRRVTLLAGHVGLAVTVLGTVFWLGAYVNGVYARGHTWQAASRWVYQNVPDGATILWELWDDPLPKPVHLLGTGLEAHADKRFRMLEWSPFNNDTPEKLDTLVQVLTETDYIIYSSTRIYRAVPRLPLRYPMTIRYYKAMFGEELGFEVVHEEIRTSRAFGLVFDDERADESWRLYDHPRVTILAKTRPVTAAEIDRLLAPELAHAVPFHVTPGSFLNPLLGLLGLGTSEPDGPDDHLPGAGSRARSRLARVLFGPDTTGTLDYPLSAGQTLDRFRFNTFGSTRAWAAALTWWTALFLIGVMAWPFCLCLFPRLPDRGYALARLLGWLVLALLPWWLAHLGVRIFTVAGVWGTVAAAAGAAAVMAWHRRRELGAFLQQHWALLVWYEVGFALAYGALVLIRMANPDLWHPWNGGEKFMDMAILNGILHSPVFPPIDPHFAGKFLNYYYFGHYLVAFLTKLTGIWSEVAFNLALPVFFALSFLLVWACVFYFHMAPRSVPSGAGTIGVVPGAWQPALRTALWAPFLLLGIGNLEGCRLLLSRLRAQSSLAPEQPELWPSLLQWPLELGSGIVNVWRGGSGVAYDYWAASRVIPETINEFPYWSFLFGDLHAHLLVMPLTLAMLSCTIYALRYLSARGWPALAILLCTALLSGAAFATNLWEIPFHLSMVALTVVAVARHLYPKRWLTMSLWAAGIFLAAVFVSLLPFWRTFELAGIQGGIGWVRQGDAPGLWFRIWGLFYLLVAGWLFWQGKRRLGVVVSPRTCAVWGGLAGAGCLAAIGLQHAMLGLAALPLALAGLMLWMGRGALHTAESHINAWLLVLLAIWTGTQVLFIKDFLQDGDYARMNTLFKFFFQAWILGALTGAMMLPALWAALRRRLGPGRAALGAAPFGVLLSASLVFVVLGTPARLWERFPPSSPPFGTLNGLAYMETGVYTWPDERNRIVLRHDREAIDWLNRHVTANAIVLESSEVEYYRAGGTRVASFTGLPGLRGLHQSEQRDALLNSRRADLMRTLWTTAEPETLLDLLQANAIGLIYAGQLEAWLHPEATARFRDLAAAGDLELVYENSATAIYALAGTSQRFLDR